VSMRLKYYSTGSVITTRRGTVQLSSDLFEGNSTRGWKSTHDFYFRENNLDEDLGRNKKENNAHIQKVTMLMTSDLKIGGEI